MKKRIINNIKKTLSLCFFILLTHVVLAQNQYIDRFTTLRNKIKDASNGYFSKDGAPYHTPETLICEAPDYGHESTSEAYSYWIWLEAMYGRVQGDWTPLNNAWAKMEALAIPTTDLQPTAGDYKPSAPATYAAEWPLPSNYPSALRTSVPVGQDPVSPELTATYGNSYVYGMHWLFDLDNFYGFGNKADGVSTPSYINTFQRGVQESVWETVPQPTWDAFKWGSDDASGYLKLFTSEASAPSKQWKYTNAPDADARVVQAMYWATQWTKSQGLNPTSTLPLAKAKKMGDYLRLSMFDKYFKPIGVQSEAGAGGTGYQSAHYLLSWYYAWGGPLTANGWAWRIGCSHSHFGYQNPVAAYALSAVPELIPTSPNASRDWNTSLGRQLELYQWLQSAEGAIAGGATNSWNGKYDPYPAGTPTFYNMAYVENPVYEDPGSNTWFGMQAWSMERVAEFYYMTNNARAKAVLDKWVVWVKSVTHLLSNGTYEIPSEIGWSGKPNTWTPAAPTANTGLHVNVVSYTQDVGVSAALAKALTYYAAATQKYATLDTASRDLAKAILDRMWTNYYEPTGKGVAYPEKRADFHRFFDQEVFIPAGWTGKMPNGDVIKPGVKFIDIRSKYKTDPDWPALVAAHTAGTDFVKTYHRFWAQSDVALANAEYGFFFGGINHPPVAAVTATPKTGLPPLVVAFNAGGSTDLDGDALTFAWTFGDNTTGTGVAPSHTYTLAGIYNAVVTVSDGKGGSSTATVAITVTVPGNHNPVAVAAATPTTGVAPLSVIFSASGSTDPDAGDVLTYSWNFGDNTPLIPGITCSHTYTAAGSYIAMVTVLDGKGGSSTASVTITVTGPANHNPVAVATATPTTGVAPLNVIFNASGSTDPDAGDVLTYSWNFGDNTPLIPGISCSHTYTVAGTYIATLTVSDGKGGSSTASVTITVTPPSTSCNFGTPLATKLPSINGSYTKVYKLGTGGPALSNVTNFTINWDLQNNGLWQMSFNTNNGNPTWYLDLRTVSTAKFNQIQPEVTFTNSGFPGLDGSYYVAISSGNFVMVSKTGGFTIYFSNAATPPVCSATARMSAPEEELVVERNNVSAYPNPFNDMFNISIGKPELVTGLFLHDQLGRVIVHVPQHEIKSNIEIRQPMTKGLYILKVQTVQGNQIIKVIKE